MKVFFRFAWLTRASFERKSFKSKAAYDITSEYVRRSAKFAPCKALNLRPPFERPKGSMLWVCDGSHYSKVLSSEEIAAWMERLMNSGIRELHIAVGGADGFSKEVLHDLKPDLRWSFGPLTLPHELAAAVAAEQIYRAWTIIKKQPYHCGH